MTKIRTEADALCDLDLVKRGRLAGGKRYAVRLDEIELQSLRGITAEEMLEHRAAAVRDCVNCKGVHIEKLSMPKTYVSEFRLKCGRERPGTMLLCDDGVKVFVSRDKELISSYEALGSGVSGTSPTRTVLDDIYEDRKRASSKQFVPKIIKEKDKPIQRDTEIDIW